MLPTYQQNGYGQWKTEEMKGPVNLADWKDGWAWIRRLFICGDVVNSGVSQRYLEMIEHLHATWGHRFWWLLAFADWHARFEWAPRELRRLRAFHLKHPTPSDVNPEMPWNTVLLNICVGPEAVAFWKYNFEDRAQAWLLNTDGLTCQSDC